MRLTVLGAGPSVPRPDAGNAAYLLEHERAWLVDAGSGAVQKAAAAGVSAPDLAGVLLTHHHPDHCADIVPLLFSGHAGRRQQVEIVGGTGIAQLMAALDTAWGRWIRPPAGSSVVELPLTGGEMSWNGARLRWAPAVHSAGALHLRVDTPDGSVAFSGDTGPSMALVELAAGVDMLVTECAARKPAKKHLHATDVVELARAAQPKYVALTHRYAHTPPEPVLDGLTALGIPAHWARDGDRWSPDEGWSRAW